MNYETQKINMWRAFLVGNNNMNVDHLKEAEVLHNRFDDWYGKWLATEPENLDIEPEYVDIVNENFWEII
jgi:hypothetical protein